MSYNNLTLSILTAVSICICTSVEAAPKTKVPVTVGSKTKTATCVLQKNRWKRRKKRSGTSSSKFERQAKKTCSSLVPKNAVDGLGDVPSNNKFLSSKFKKVKSSSIDIEDVSGTPPALPTIPSQEVKNLFWRDGVIDRLVAGNPTADDCNEFYGGNTDGQSGGLSACFMTEGTAIALENFLRSGASLCYLRNIPNLVNGTSISVISGSENLPGGDPTRIFETPEKSTSRLVKISLKYAPDDDEHGDTEGDIFINIHNQESNKTNKRQYGVDLNFCAETGSGIDSFEQILIGRDGLVNSISKGVNEFERENENNETVEITSTFRNVVQGYLTQKKSDGVTTISYNSRLPRSLEIIEVSDDQQSSFRANVEINSQNEILSKTYQEGIRAYSIINFLGTDASDAQFLSGGYKDEKDNQPGDGFRSFTDFRDTLYVAAPTSSLSDKLDEVDVQTDSFYTSSTAPDFDSASFNCDTAVADIEIEMDFETPELQAITPICEGEVLPEMDYCYPELIEQAEENIPTSCSQ